MLGIVIDGFYSAPAAVQLVGKLNTAVDKVWQHLFSTEKSDVINLKDNEIRFIDIPTS